MEQSTVKRVDRVQDVGRRASDMKSRENRVLKDKHTVL